MDDRAFIDFEEVNVAWICAITDELVVAQAALDEEYRLRHTTDFLASSSQYSVGRIGNHKIVIACLENARNAGAATKTAERLNHAFKHIELSLMVGIGGGVPYWGDDIRLGDIVVGQPQHSSSGVIAWDGGKALENDFDFRGHYASPTDRLLSAAIALDARKKLRRRNLNDELAAVIEQINTELYEPIDRPEESSSLDTDPNNTHRYPKRRNTTPQVHRGIIASGGSVKASRKRRNEIAQQVYDKINLKVLCFEMEAADLVNSLPCLIVRGISDFADEVKNDDWHGYAALAAAAYAKTLINSIEASQHRSEQEATSKKDLLVSLSFPDMWSRQEQLNSAQEGTFRWILEEDDEAVNPFKNHWDSFKTWLKGHQKTYWIHGKPGSGKSTLVQYLFGHEKDLLKALQEWSGGKEVLMPRAFLWRLGSLKQHSLSGMLRSLVFQVLSDSKAALQQASESPGVTSPGVWTIPRLKVTLFDAIEASGSYICFFIDGLDEFHGFQDAQSRRIPVDCDETVDDLLDCLHQLSKFDRVKICISSRPEVALQDAFKSFPQLRLEDLTSSDIRLYVGEKLRRIPGSGALQTSIDSRAQGVFLWVKLVVECLLRGYSKRDSAEDLLRRLDQMPSRLESFYEHMLENLDPVTKSECIFGMSLVHHLKTSAGHIDQWFGNGMVHAFVMMRRCKRHPERLKELRQGSLPNFNLDSLSTMIKETLERMTALSCGIIETFQHDSKPLLGFPISPSELFDPLQEELFKDSGTCKLKDLLECRQREHRWMYTNLGGFIAESAPSFTNGSAMTTLQNAVGFIHRTAGEFVYERFLSQGNASSLTRQTALLVMDARGDIAALFSMLYRRLGITKVFIDVCDLVWLKPIDGPAATMGNFPEDPAACAILDTMSTMDQVNEADFSQASAVADEIQGYCEFERVTSDDCAIPQDFDNLWSHDPDSRQHYGLLIMCAAVGLHKYCVYRMRPDDGVAATLVCAAATLSLYRNMPIRTDRQQPFLDDFVSFLKTVVERGADTSVRMWTFDSQGIAQPGATVWAHLLRLIPRILWLLTGKTNIEGILDPIFAALDVLYPGHDRHSHVLLCFLADEVAFNGSCARITLEMNPSSILRLLQGSQISKLAAPAQKRLAAWALEPDYCVPLATDVIGVVSKTYVLSHDESLWSSAAWRGHESQPRILLADPFEVELNQQMQSRLQYLALSLHQSGEQRSQDAKRPLYTWHDPRNEEGPCFDSTLHLDWFERNPSEPGAALSDFDENADESFDNFVLVFDSKGQR